MDYGKEFKNYAINHQGISSMYYEKIMSSMYPVNMTPNIIEERQMNVIAMDVYSRLMMDRIIFLGTGINDQVANIVQAQLLFWKVSTHPKIFRSTSTLREEVSMPAWASTIRCSLLSPMLPRYVQEWPPLWALFYYVPDRMGNVVA